MPKGISLHIGLNQVDPAAYGGWNGRLRGCINDARAMEKIASGLGYTTTLLTDGEATIEHVLATLGRATAELEAGDILLITYSGHGGQVSDITGDEDDGLDETWVLYDGELLDDELYLLWAQLPPGVRVAVCVDSCHAGTAIKQRNRERFAAALRQGEAPPTTRDLPDDVQARLVAQNARRYARLQWLAAGESRNPVQATVLLLAACQDNQLSADGSPNGRFTAELLRVWNDGEFAGGYRAFVSAITRRMPPDQTPRYTRLGAPSRAFERQRPFTI